MHNSHSPAVAMVDNRQRQRQVEEGDRAGGRGVSLVPWFLAWVRNADKW